MKLTDNLYFYPEKGTLDSNSYVIRGNPGVIIDPGVRHFLPARVRQMREDGIEPETIGIIANTHLHGDHCGANEAFKELSGARITLHAVQKQFYDVAVVETAQFFGLPATEFTADGYFEDGKLRSGAMEFELIPCPGHSPDSVCFYSPKDKVLISGDVIFQGNIGRFDLPGGSAGELSSTIERLAKLDIEYVLPGHMDIVTGRDSVKHNFELIREMLKWM